jgi:hypothetical protein
MGKQPSEERDCEQIRKLKNPEPLTDKGKIPFVFFTLPYFQTAITRSRSRVR